MKDGGEGKTGFCMSLINFQEGMQKSGCVILAQEDWLHVMPSVCNSPIQGTTAFSSVTSHSAASCRRHSLRLIDLASPLVTLGRQHSHSSRDAIRENFQLPTLSPGLDLNSRAWCVAAELCSCSLRVGHTKFCEADLCRNNFTLLKSLIKSVSSPEMSQWLPVVIRKCHHGWSQPCHTEELRNRAS